MNKFEKFSDIKERELKEYSKETRKGRKRVKKEVISTAENTIKDFLIKEEKRLLEADVIGRRFSEEFSRERFVSLAISEKLREEVLNKLNNLWVDLHPATKYKDNFKTTLGIFEARVFIDHKKYPFVTLKVNFYSPIDEDLVTVNLDMNWYRDVSASICYGKEENLKVSLNQKVYTLYSDSL
ncbi:hypothetical protein FK483_0057 [Listeria phage LP-018]|uniref:Uncharacterized protein n=1 Tax=Listeria phage LP-018 TaxID=2590048 RepID=A0A6C0QZU7_9CAUD|nr:hypothetical protein FK483_0057 [Listeria phage LP-018]